jgi:hypothetical protein
MDTLTYDQMMETYGFIPFNHQKPNFFPVGTQPIFDQAGKAIPGHKAVMRGDTGDVLAVHSDKYSMVPYEEHFQIFEEAIEVSNLNSVNMRIATDFQDNGAKIFRQYLFPEHTMMLDTRSGTRPIALRIYMFDSYDGTTAWQGRAGFFDFVCANSAIFGTEIDSIRFKHVGDMKEKVYRAADMLTDAADKFIANFPRLQKWPQIDLGTMRFSELIKALPQSNDRLIDNLTAEYGRSQYGTLWDAHTLLTSWSTHGTLLTSWSTHGIPARTQADRQKRVAALVESVPWKHYEEA